MIYALAASSLIVVFGVGVAIRHRIKRPEPRVNPTPESWRAADRLIEEVKR